MSIAHLHYCIEEILLANKLLKVANCDFYKRALVRTIALRTDDFIKIGFSVNKQSGSPSQRIRNDLNALKDMYDNYFKLQRDKYGAHFQDLDLVTRLEAWSSISLISAEFFSTIPYSIYLLFSGVVGYIPIGLPLLPVDERRIVEINDKHNIEKYPNISSDILSLTRPHTGGLVHQDGLQTKAGALKSLELLINYEFDLYKLLRGTSLEGVVLKLVIVDLVSYADNFITRRDVATGAPQNENALDHYLALPLFAKNKKILDDFKRTYKFNEFLAELRIIRNKIAGHLDTTLSIIDCKSAVETFEVEKYENFYNLIRKTFKKICFEGFMLRTFAIEVEPLHNGSSITALEIQTFDGLIGTPATIEILDINSDEEYKKQLDSWVNDKNEKACNFFWQCSCSSNMVSTLNRRIELADGNEVTLREDVRKIHVFFEDTLTGVTSLSEEKRLKIVELFIALRSGYPDVLAEILLKTFPKDESGRQTYMHGLGYLLRNPTIQFHSIYKKMVEEDNFYSQYHALIAAFRVDLRYRFDNQGKHMKGETILSQAIFNQLKSPRLDWVALTQSLALAGEYSYGHHHTGEAYKAIYFNVFESLVTEALNKTLSNLPQNAKRKRILQHIKVAFRTRRYITFLALVADYLKKIGHRTVAKRLYFTISENLLPFATQDAQELLNYAIACQRSDKLHEAIITVRHIIDMNPDNYYYYYPLLQFYLFDRQYEDEFNRVKELVLTSFNLSTKDQRAYQKLLYIN